MKRNKSMLAQMLKYEIKNEQVLCDNALEWPRVYAYERHAAKREALIEVAQYLEDATKKNVLNWLYQDEKKPACATNTDGLRK